MDENELVECEYCYKKIPAAEVVKETIWVNGSQHEGQYCSKQHAAYAQMSAEG